MTPIIHAKQKYHSRIVFSAGYKERLWLSQDKQCRYCKEPLNFADVLLDHVSPFYYTRNNEPYNIVVCCAVCNFRKGRLIFVYYEEIENYMYNYKHPIPVEELSKYPNHTCFIPGKVRRIFIPNTLLRIPLEAPASPNPDETGKVVTE